MGRSHATAFLLNWMLCTGKNGVNNIQEVIKMTNYREILRLMSQNEAMINKLREMRLDNNIKKI